MIEDVQVQGMASHDLQLPSTIRPPKADELHGFPQAPISAQGGQGKTRSPGPNFFRNLRLS